MKDRGTVQGHASQDYHLCHGGNVLACSETTTSCESICNCLPYQATLIWLVAFTAVACAVLSKGANRKCGSSSWPPYDKNHRIVGRVGSLPEVKNRKVLCRGFPQLRNIYRGVTIAHYFSTVGLWLQVLTALSFPPCSSW